MHAIDRIERFLCAGRAGGKQHKGESGEDESAEDHAEPVLGLRLYRGDVTGGRHLTPCRDKQNRPPVRG